MILYSLLIPDNQWYYGWGRNNKKMYDDDDAAAADDEDGDDDDEDEDVEKKCRETSRIIISFDTMLDSIALCRDLFEFVFRFYFY